MSVNVVTLHDVGKINPLFQKLKMKNNWKTEYAPESISSRHSIVSAIFYLDYFLGIINTAKGDGRINRDESDVLKDFAYIYSYIISLVSLKELSTIHTNGYIITQAKQKVKI